MSEMPFKEVSLAEHRPASHEVALIKLSFNFRSECEVVVTNSMSIIKNADPKAEQTAGAITLYGSKKHIDLKKIKIDGRDLGGDDYHISENGELTIYRVPDQFTIDLEGGLNPSANSSCMGLYVSEGIYCTQCEPEGFRNITYSMDRPDAYSKFEVSIEADAERYTSLLSNGVPHEAVVVNGRKKITWVDSRPKPAYLFALCVGDFDVLEDAFIYPNGREIALKYFVNTGDMEKARWAMACLKDAMMHEYNRWGHEYHSRSNVFMTVAVDTFVFGAMENTGLNVFNSTYVLADPETATDERYLSVDFAVDHEFAHDETGNRRVPSSWFQIGYKEGLTVLREQTYLEDKYGFAEQRIKQVIKLRSTVFSYDAGPMSHPVVLGSYLDIQNNYDVITYPKGAEVNRMLQTLVGKSDFRKAYREYHNVDSTAPATIKSWLEHVSTSTGNQLYQFIETWLEQSGVPILEVIGTYDKAEQHYALTIKQKVPEVVGDSRKSQKPFHIPFMIGLVGRSGEDIQLIPADNSFRINADGVIEITQKEQTFTFNNIQSEPIPSLNRDFSAYVKVNIERSRKNLAFLAANDSNQVSRWDSVQQLGLLACQDAIDAVSNNVEVQVDPYILDVFKSIIADDALSNALKTEMLKLPEQEHVASLQDRGQQDPIVIYQARKRLLSKLGAALNTEFIAIYESCRNTVSEYTPSPLEMGRRGLMNLSLHYLINAEGFDHIALAQQQFEQQENYNDMYHALLMLASANYRRTKNDALNIMYQKYRSNSIVMNDWLKIHAETAALSDIKELTKNTVFSYQNPNKVNSLIGVFAGKNSLAFHKDDGTGYEFVSDKIINMDGINSKVATGLLAPFTKAPNYTPKRRAQMLNQLRRIQEALADNISKNVYEIIHKTLNT